MVLNAELGENVDWALFEGDLMKMRQEARSIGNKLQEEEVDFNLLLALSFHDHLRKENCQLASLLRGIIKRCMDPNFQEKLQVKTHTENHRNNRLTNSIMTLSIQRSSVTIESLPMFN